MTYIYEPGDVIRSSEHNKNINDLYKVQGEKAINDVSATNSGVLAGSSQVLIDKFLDANGQNNTIDWGNSTTFQYWDISTASFKQSFDVSTKNTAPHDLFFKPDGLELYIIGVSPQDVLQYTLSTAWDISTATFTRSFDVSAKEVIPEGLTFKSDGTEMYITGNTTDSVHQYTLGTAWNISTANFTQSFSVAAKETTPTGLTFKSDGTEMYITGNTSDSVHQYTLGTAWNISTANFTQSFSVAAKEATPTGLTFKSDGTEMYIMGYTSDSVHQYTLSSAWNISTANFTRSYSVSAKEATPIGLTFKSDGTEMYITGNTSDSVHQYTLNTAWNTSNKYIFAAYDGTTYYDSTIQSSATTIPSGKTKVFVTPLMYEVLSTGDSITADVSIDNGAHYTTGVPINTWTPITSANGTQLIVKANLLTNDGTTSPKILGWRVLME